jgi:A/G-specific adenine glycosylase
MGLRNGSDDIRAQLAQLKSDKPLDIPQFQKFVLAFYRKRGRAFPWRETHDPYAILVSEIMLQQTQTERVVPKYEAFLKEFPTVKDLACASAADVVRMWMGLGYYRRALNLHRAALVVSEEHSGTFPQTLEGLRELPGVGPYTASAVAAFAFGVASPMIETNIRTVYLATFFRDREGVSDAEILEMVERSLYRRDPRRWFYALMDLGVELKKSTKGINTRSKHYTKQSKFQGSHRQVRAAVLKSISEVPRSKAKIVTELPFEKLRIEQALVELEQEGFITRDTRRRVYALR